MSIRVLHVDNDALFRRVVKRSLGALGFELHSADSFEAALAAARDRAFDVALVDLDLGLGPDGFELVAKLRELHPELPSIILSGSIEHQDQRAAQGVRMCPKPTPPKQLASLIEQVAAPRA